MVTRYRSRVPASEAANAQDDGIQENLFEETEIDTESDPFGAVADPSADRSERLAMGKALGQSGAGGGNEMGTAGSALMMSGNPYAMAAGGGLMVLGARQKRLENEANARWQEKQSRIERQQSAISKLIGVSNSLRNL